MGKVAKNPNRNKKPVRERKKLKTRLTVDLEAEKRAK